MNMFERHADEIRAIKNGADMSTECYDDLYGYYLNTGEMPYGTAKARDGDPYQWIINRIDDLPTCH